MLPCESWLGSPAPDLQASKVQGGAEGSHVMRVVLCTLLLIIFPVVGILLVCQSVQILQVPGWTLQS